MFVKFGSAIPDDVILGTGTGTQTSARQEVSIFDLVTVAPSPALTLPKRAPNFSRASEKA